MKTRINGRGVCLNGEVLEVVVVYISGTLAVYSQLAFKLFLKYLLNEIINNKTYSAVQIYPKNLVETSECIHAPFDCNNSLTTMMLGHSAVKSTYVSESSQFWEKISFVKQFQLHLLKQSSPPFSLLRLPSEPSAQSQSHLSFPLAPPPLLECQ